MSPLGTSRVQLVAGYPIKADGDVVPLNNLYLIENFMRNWVSGGIGAKCLYGNLRVRDELKQRCGSRNSVIQEG